jgi:hypothetical protein
MPADIYKVLQVQAFSRYYLGLARLLVINVRLLLLVRLR